MTQDTVTPIIIVEDKAAPLGRRADLMASILGYIGALLSVVSAIWFFSGFAENDTRPEHLTSAFFLTLGLFAFAVLPFFIVARFARQANRDGTKPAHLFWALFLMLPWIGLGLTTIFYTPLPLFVGIIMTGLAALLSLWAGVSLVLDWNAAPANTPLSQQDEMSVTPE
jgi:small-conductance mechanosensitive channel